MSGTLLSVQSDKSSEAGSDGKKDSGEEGKSAKSESAKESQKSESSSASKDKDKDKDKSKSSSASQDEDKSSSASQDEGKSGSSSSEGDKSGSSSSSIGEKGEGSSSSSSGGKDEGGGSAADDEPASPTLAGLYLFYENYDKPTKPLAYNPTADPLIVKDKGTMELYAQSEFTNGNISWVADSGVGVVWSIEKTLDEDGAEQDKQIAEVDRAEGVVRALGQGNGKIVVRCQAQSYDVHADITITIKGNAGVPYLTDLQICDEGGIPYDNDAEIRIDSADFGLEKKFTLRATYHDPAIDADIVRETAKGDVVEGATWTVSGDSKVSYVNPDTGAFIAQATGSVRLSCSVAGAGLLGDTLSDYVFVLCGGDTLDPDRDYSPADELKVVVKYATEDKQGLGGEEDYETARTWYYTPSELEALGVTENLYTLVKHSGSWGTMKARGIYFERLIEDVINSDDFSIDQVKGFYFGSTDDYNPGFVGEAWLFETQRYYYPNMSIGSGNLGAVPVAPMIATQTVQEDLIDEPAGELSDQTRFRLCLGAESTTVNNAQQSIYNVYKITVILNGAPPVGWDEPDNGHEVSATDGTGDAPNGSSDEKDDADGDGAGDNEPGNGGNEGDGSGGSDGEDEPGGGGTDLGDSPKPGPGATGPSDDNTSGGDPGSGADDGDATPRPDGAEARQEAEQAEQLASGSNVRAAEQTVEVRADAAEATETADAIAASEATERAIEDMVGDSQHRYQVYEMMSAQPELLEALELDNPLAPFVAPVLALVALAGGAYSWLWFRRQMMPSGTPSMMRVAAAALMSAIAR